MPEANSDETRNDVAAQPHDDLPKVKLDFSAGGILKVGMSGSFDLIDAGAGNASVSAGLIGQLSVLGSHGNKVDEKASNFALGFLESMAPKDAAETLLVAQMAAIHQATMMMARRLNLVDTLAQQDGAERALNKLARTFALQVEALKRYRTGGQQRVVVEHVTVNAGGQAIVGSVTRGGGGKEN